MLPPNLFTSMVSSIIPVERPQPAVAQGTQPVSPAPAVPRGGAGDVAEFSNAARAALAAEEGEQNPRNAQAPQPERPADNRSPEQTAAGDAGENGASENDDSEENNDGEQATTARERGVDGQPLLEAEQREVAELRERDAEVRTHEQAHLAAAGGLARGGPRYDFQRGPDGRQYAVGGEVSIDTAPESEPEATIRKMEQVRSAALAPAEPSNADRAIANQASQQANQARAELLNEQMRSAETQTPGITQNGEGDNAAPGNEQANDQTAADDDNATVIAASPLTGTAALQQNLALQGLLGA